MLDLLFRLTAKVTDANNELEGRLMNDGMIEDIA